MGHCVGLLAGTMHMHSSHGIWALKEPTPTCGDEMTSHGSSWAGFEQVPDHLPKLWIPQASSQSAERVLTHACHARQRLHVCQAQEPCTQACLHTTSSHNRARARCRVQGCIGDQLHNRMMCASDCFHKGKRCKRIPLSSKPNYTPGQASCSRAALAMHPARCVHACPGSEKSSSSGRASRSRAACACKCCSRPSNPSFVPPDA